ncbi:MAG: hypothetical protein LC635_00760 [Pseudonocardiaceae bacterium]|nr:hypothetical protein [Pseudonocardiaceae bacterium]
MKSRQRVPEPAVTEADWSDGAARAATEDVRELLRVERRRRRWRWFAGGLVVLAVGAVVALLVESSVFEPVPGDPTGPDSPATRASTARAPMFDERRPFDSTPAARWRDGAAGITLPDAEAVSGFSATRVAEATELVRDVLVASRLDPALLVRHDPTEYLALLAPDARRQLVPLFGGGREPEVQSLVSMVADGSPLLPVDPKVSGSMSVRAGDAGELVVHTNFVFAYAFQPASPTRLVDAMNVIVVVRADVDYVLRAGDHWTSSSRGLWYDEASGFAYSIGCDAYRKGFLAPAASERAVTAPAGAGEQASFFDPTAPLPAAAGCRP